MPIYFLADTIIRGDDFPRMGRTILEGLYSGCNVLLPGGTQDYSSIESDMHNLLFFYKKRDGDSFIYSLRKCISRGKSVKEGKSSTSIYIKEFLNFLN
jgi:hypothetical protein